jgi:hypothetical protein
VMRVLRRCCFKRATDMETRCRSLVKVLCGATVALVVLTAFVFPPSSLSSPALSGSEGEPVVEATSKNASVLEVCFRRLGRPGGLPGLWDADHHNWAPLDPACASVWTETAKRDDDLTLMAGRAVWFLGDSVLRDLAVSLESRLLGNSSTADSSTDARLRAKRNCIKGDNAQRTDDCRMIYGGGAVGRFSWHQWFATPHRLPWGLAPGRGSAYQQQELDICCRATHDLQQLAGDITVRSAGLRACLAALFVNSSARDVLVLRAGLNYPLYDPGVGYETAALRIGEWPVALESDMTFFFQSILPMVFPGTVVMWQLDPGITAGGILRACSAGPLTQVAQLLPAARAIQARVILESMSAGPLVKRLLTIDTTNIIASDDDKKVLYTDCIHHGDALNRVKVIALIGLLRTANMPL